MDKGIDLEEQYDKIYRYCYFKLRRREEAEDITQETFLRFYERFGHYGNEWTLQYLYRMAHNLCVDEYRKASLRQDKEKLLDDEMPTANYESHENKVLNEIVVKDALSALSEEEKEMLLLRYVNEVSVAVMCKLFRISRFALYRKLEKALQKLKKELLEEETL